MRRTLLSGREVGLPGSLHLNRLSRAQDAGLLVVSGATVRRTLSFLDYMAGGCEINFMCALDFSGGNAPAEDPASAHHTGTDGQAPSVYERALAALGAVMQFYDPLRSFPLWGFGGQVRASRVETLRAKP